MSKPVGEKLALLFFSETEKLAHKWKCQICCKVVCQADGYSNLCGHVRTHHQDDVEQRMAASNKRKRDAFESLIYFRKTQSVHGWLECVVLTLQPFAIVEILFSVVV